jgi:DNA-3-methyladenine glycosylase I
MSYCVIASSHQLHNAHHGEEHGYPVADDRILFERLVLELHQPGLSWLTMLKKRAAFREAFADYHLPTLAAFTEEDIVRLLQDASIIRHRGKIEATIYNAQQVRKLQGSYGSFKEWLSYHHPSDLAEWNKLFRKTFKFTGPSVVKEFLMSVGYWPGAHQQTCSVYQAILALNPPWLMNKAWIANKERVDDNY